MPLADGVVVRIEEVAVSRVEDPVLRHMRLQYEGLEEPGGMREMPLRRAGIRHGLDGAILGRQRRYEIKRGLADGSIRPRMPGVRQGDRMRALLHQGWTARRGHRSSYAAEDDSPSKIFDSYSRMNLAMSGVLSERSI